MPVRSTRTSGIALTFLWCLRTLSITRESHTTSPRSSTPTSPLTTRPTRLTVLSSSLLPLLCLTDSRLHQSPQPSATLSSTTGNRSGVRLVAHSPNNLTSTLASCLCTRRSRIGGIYRYLVRAPFLNAKRANCLIFFVVSMFVFGVIAIEVWNTQFPVWAFVLSLIICALIYFLV
jgi:hypothetical protein